MNKEYLRAMAVAENALVQIKGIYVKVPTEGFEDRKACKSLKGNRSYRRLCKRYKVLF